MKRRLVWRSSCPECFHHRRCLFFNNRTLSTSFDRLLFRSLSLSLSLSVAQTFSTDYPIVFSMRKFFFYFPFSLYGAVETPMGWWNHACFLTDGRVIIINASLIANNFVKLRIHVFKVALYAAIPLPFEGSLSTILSVRTVERYGRNRACPRVLSPVLQRRLALSVSLTATSVSRVKSRTHTHHTPLFFTGQGTILNDTTASYIFLLKNFSRISFNNF